MTDYSRQEALRDEWADAADPLPAWMVGGPFRVSRARPTVGGWPQRDVTCLDHPEWRVEGAPWSTVSQTAAHIRVAHRDLYDRFGLGQQFDPLP